MRHTRISPRKETVDHLKDAKAWCALSTGHSTGHSIWAFSLT